MDPDEGSQLAPAGFYLIQLPFAEDVRCNPAPHVAATAENTLNTLYNNTIQGMYYILYCTVFAVLYCTTTVTTTIVLL